MVRKAYFEQVERAPRDDGETKPAVLNSEINLTLTSVLNREAPHGQVTLGVVVRPDQKWQPYRIEVVVSGVFAAQNATLELFEEFCQQAVPSILFPYVRQLVHTLTIDGAYGFVRLNPINVQQLMSKSWEPVPMEPSASEPSQPSEQSPSASQE